MVCRLQRGGGDPLCPFSPIFAEYLRIFAESDSEVVKLCCGDI